MVVGKNCRSTILNIGLFLTWCFVVVQLIESNRGYVAEMISREYMLPSTILKHESISNRKYVLPLIASIIVVKGLLLLLVLARVITSKKSDPKKRCLKFLVYVGMFWVLEVVLFNVYTLIYGYIFLSTFTKSYLINRITMDLLILFYCSQCGMEALQEEKIDKKQISNEVFVAKEKTLENLLTKDESIRDHVFPPNAMGEKTPFIL